MTEAEKEFRQYKRKAIKAAKELGYGDEVIKQIGDSKTSDDICRIMKNARANCL